MSKTAATIDERAAGARTAYIDEKRRRAAASLSRTLEMSPDIDDEALQLDSETNGRIYFAAEIEEREFLVAVGEGDSTFVEFWIRYCGQTERFEGLRELPLAERRLKERVHHLYQLLGCVSLIFLALIIARLIASF